jgi:ABC-type branched-subunit amino acid transport system ATPase component
VICGEGAVTELLRLEGLSVAFGGLRAVQDVRITVREGTLTALIGPNGAGKTTVFALVSGFLKPDAGLGVPEARRRPRRLRGPRHHRARAASERARRHDAHVPDRAAFCGADGAREHRGRRAPA